MSGFYTVLAAENKGTKPNPHGGTLVKWYITLRNSAGDQLSDVYWQRKEGSEANVGDTIYGSVTRGEYGPRFKMEPKPDGAQGTPPASSAGPQASRTGASPQQPGSPPKAADGAGTFDERQRRIERQHSQEMALRYMALIDSARAEVKSRGMAAMVPLIDWFANDLSPHSAPSTAHSPPDNGGAGREEPAPPASLEQKVNEEVASGGLVEEYDF